MIQLHHIILNTGFGFITSNQACALIGIEGVELSSCNCSILSAGEILELCSVWGCRRRGRAWVIVVVAVRVGHYGLEMIFSSVNMIKRFLEELMLYFTKKKVGDSQIVA